MTSLIPLWITAAAAGRAPQPYTVAVIIQDDAALPIMVARKTRADLVDALWGAATMKVQDVGETWDRLEDRDPLCGDDTICWLGALAAVDTDRLVVVELVPDGDRERALVRVLEHYETTAVPIADVLLPRGGGFPIDLGTAIGEKPLGLPPIEQAVEEKKGFLARLFSR